MAGKTQGEKIDELKELCAALKVRLEFAVQELDAVYETHSKTSEALADLRREHETEIALLKREIDDLEKWRDEQKKQQEEQSRRISAYGPSLVGAIIGGLITAAVAYFLKR